MTVRRLLLQFAGLALAAAAAGQQVDPYYINMLKAGKAAYGAKDFRKAVHYLDLAVFGLHPQKALAAEAGVYLGLAHTFLEDRVKAEEAFSRAQTFLAPDGLDTLDLDGPVRRDLEKALTSIGWAWSRPPDAVFDPAKPEESRVSQPADPVSLAKKEFGRKRYKQALEGLNKALNPSNGTSLGEDSRLKARIYVTLCLFKLGRLKETGAYYESLKGEFPEAAISAALREEGLEDSWRLMAARFPGTN
jgi:tetratricopeptide (TPR) repeat protein